jgi:hypothetical protein
MSLSYKQKESAEREKRKELGIVTSADINYRKYKNAQQLEREKYLRNCEFTSFDHSDTSSDCSFDEDANAIIMKSQDKNYNIRIEKLLPKSLRRIRFHEISAKKDASREEIFDDIRENPMKYRKCKGLREFFVLEQKQKEKNEKKKVSKIAKNIYITYPWLSLLSPNEAMMDDTARDQIIREKYYEIINSDMTPDELINSSDIIKFIQWYEGVRNKTIEPAKFNVADFEIETNGKMQKLRMIKQSTTKKKCDQTQIGVIDSSDD